jgi:hypothetical protein
MRPLSRIPPSNTPPPNSFVSLRYEWIAGLSGGIETLPALVIRSSIDPASGHQLVNVVPFGDGCPDGLFAAPVSGSGEPLVGLYLFDALGGVVPDVRPVLGRGVFATRRVWCERVTIDGQ